jgi:hypothetical protein
MAVPPYKALIIGLEEIVDDEGSKDNSGVWQACNDC